MRRAHRPPPDRAVPRGCDRRSARRHSVPARRDTRMRRMWPVDLLPPLRRQKRPAGTAGAGFAGVNRPSSHVSRSTRSSVMRLAAPRCSRTPPTPPPTACCGPHGRSRRRPWRSRTPGLRQDVKATNAEKVIETIVEMMGTMMGSQVRAELVGAGWMMTMGDGAAGTLITGDTTIGRGGGSGRGGSGGATPGWVAPGLVAPEPAPCTAGHWAGGD